VGGENTNRPSLLKIKKESNLQESDKNCVDFSVYFFRLKYEGHSGLQYLQSQRNPWGRTAS
jgi:hypothetical protein